MKMDFGRFVSARSARYYAIDRVMCTLIKQSGRLIRAVRLRTGRKTNMAAFYRETRCCHVYRETVCLNDCSDGSKSFLLYPRRLPEVIS